MRPGPALRHRGRVVARRPRRRRAFYGNFPDGLARDRAAVMGLAGRFRPDRASRATLYNQYMRCSTDPFHGTGDEGIQMPFRPLFITSFVIDDYLADGDFYGARAVLVSSASSKTAFGLAWQLSLRRPGGPEVIGLTSARNLAFVESLGCYDRVVAYEAFDGIAPDLPVAYVDFSGDRAFRVRLNRHFGDALRLSLAVGASHRDALAVPEADRALPGATPRFFFAPAQIRKRSEEWGAAGFQERIADAWQRFANRAVEGRGREVVEATDRTLLDGRVRPGEGPVLSLSAVE